MLKVKERKEPPTTAQKTGCDINHPLSLGPPPGSWRVGTGRPTLGGGEQESAMLLWGLTVPVVLRYQVDCLTQKPGSRCGGPRLTSDSGVPAGMATGPLPRTAGNTTSAWGAEPHFPDLLLERSRLSCLPPPTPGDVDTVTLKEALGLLQGQKSQQPGHGRRFPGDGAAGQESVTFHRIHSSLTTVRVWSLCQMLPSQRPRG